MSTNKEIQIDDLFGTWMLVSMQRTIVETEEIVDLNPDGTPPLASSCTATTGACLFLISPVDDLNPTAWMRLLMSSVFAISNDGGLGRNLHDRWSLGVASCRSFLERMLDGDNASPQRNARRRKARLYHHFASARCPRWQIGHGQTGVGKGEAVNPSRGAPPPDGRANGKRRNTVDHGDLAPVRMNDSVTCCVAPIDGQTARMPAVVSVSTSSSTISQPCDAA